MDPVTHTAIGFTLAQAGAKRLTKNWAWIIFFAGSAPDVDVLPFISGDVNVLNWHRHFTHALFFAPLMALAVVVGVKYVLRRELAFRGAFLLALMGVIAHDLTDFLTHRGTRILLPFSDRVFALQIESFVDPVIYLLLGIGLSFPFLANLVSGEIGAKKASGRPTACIVLAFCLLWWGARYTFRQQAVAELSSRVYDGIAPRRVDVVPTYQPFRFRGFVDGGAFVKILEVNLLDYFDPEDAESLFRPVPDVEAGLALRTAASSHSAQIFLSWARWPFPKVTRLDGESRWVVVFEDLAALKQSTRPRVVIRLDENYAIQSEVYERSKSSTGF